MELTQAGHDAVLDRYIGYRHPYSTSHQELDADQAVQEEARAAANSLLQGVRQLRSGKLAVPEPRSRPLRDK